MDEGNATSTPADQEQLQAAWLEWARANLGADPERGLAAATAAREAITAGRGINAAYEAARLAYGPTASSADDTVVSDRSVTLGDRLAAWQAAGLIDAATAARIQEFEGRRPAAERTGGGISVSEVIAYIGTVVLLVGVGFLYGTQYQSLGTSGRLVILGLVVLTGLAAGELVRRIGATAAARRARAAGWTVAAVATTFWFAQAFVDSNILTRPGSDGSPPDPTGSIMLATFLGADFAAFLLWRAGAGLIAVAVAALTVAAAGAVDAYVGGSPTYNTELPFLVAGAVLAALAELVARGHDRRWAREVLRFGAILPLTIASLVLSANDSVSDLEGFAVVVALGAFGLALVRGSAGYAIAGGIALFIVVNEVGFRHFAQSLGFPVVLIISGITLFLVAGGLVRLLPRLRRGV